jgi:hypothetical protein
MHNLNNDSATKLTDKRKQMMRLKKTEEKSEECVSSPFLLGVLAFTMINKETATLIFSYWLHIDGWLRIKRRLPIQTKVSGSAVALLITADWRTSILKEKP